MNLVSANIGAWNIREAVHDEARMETVMTTVIEADPDQMTFLEAYHEGDDSNLGAVIDQFDAAGYVVDIADYDDADDRRDRHGSLAICKKELFRGSTTVRAASRTILRQTVALAPAADDAFDVYGMHFNDRSNVSRLVQSVALNHHIRREPSNPGVIPIVAGLIDFERSTKVAQALRLAGPLAHRLPSADPTPEMTMSKLERAGSVLTRLSELATGATLADMKASNGLVDLTPDAINTMHTSGIWPFRGDYVLGGPSVYAESNQTVRVPDVSNRAAVFVRIALTR